MYKAKNRKEFKFLRWTFPFKDKGKVYDSSCKGDQSTGLGSGFFEKNILT